MFHLGLLYPRVVIEKWVVLFEALWFQIVQAFTRNSRFPLIK